MPFNVENVKEVTPVASVTKVAAVEMEDFQVDMLPDLLVLPMFATPFNEVNA